MQRGKFITFEGIEGVGKSTQVTLVAKHLRQPGREIIETREPGGTTLGEVVRGLLLAPSTDPIAPLTELLLMFAARAEHIAKVIEPALHAGKWVLSDRFTDATYAYQGGGRNMDPVEIRSLELLVQKQLQPDLTIWLDLPVDLALSRAKKRSASDRFEQETASFFKRVRETYRARAETEPQRFAVIDAGRPIEAVESAIISALNERLT